MADVIRAILLAEKVAGISNSWVYCSDAKVRKVHIPINDNSYAILIVTDLDNSALSIMAMVDLDPMSVKDVKIGIHSSNSAATSFLEDSVRNVRERLLN